MNVDVMVNGRPWKVAVVPAEQAGTFTVTIKGKSRIVDASWIDADTLSLIDGGTAREIRLHARDTGAIGVEFGGKLYEAVIAPPAARLKSGTGAMGAMGATGAMDAPGATGAVGTAVPTTSAGLGGSVGLGFSQAIKAPMPGRVVRVLVAVGDHVTAKQAVVVVEAMKMENELRTPRAGVVKEVLVTPGATVESGAVLVVVDQ
jgi:biotin carboxyl carrier protein